MERGNGHANEMRVPWIVERDAEFRLLIRDAFDAPNVDPVLHTQRARPDLAPEVVVNDPDGDLTLPPDGSFDLKALLTDDYGVAEAALVFENGAVQGRITLGAKDALDPTHIEVSRSISITEIQARDGDVVTWMIEAIDNRHDLRGQPSGQSGLSPARLIRIRAPRDAESRTPPTPLAGESGDGDGGAGDPDGNDEPGDEDARRQAGSEPGSDESDSRSDADPIDVVGDDAEGSDESSADGTGPVDDQDDDVRPGPDEGAGDDGASDDIESFVDENREKIDRLTEELDADSVDGESSNDASDDNPLDEAGKKETGDNETRESQPTDPADQPTGAKEEGKTSDAESVQDPSDHDAPVQGGNDKPNANQPPDRNKNEPDDPSDSGQKDSKNDDDDDDEGSGKSGAKDGAEAKKQSDGSEEKGADSANGEGGENKQDGAGGSKSAQGQESEQKGAGQAGKAGGGDAEGEGKPKSDPAGASGEPKGKSDQDNGDQEQDGANGGVGGTKGQADGPADTNQPGTTEKLGGDQPGKGGGVGAGGDVKTRDEPIQDDSRYAGEGDSDDLTVDIERAERAVNELERRLREGRLDPALLAELGWDEAQAAEFVRAFKRHLARHRAARELRRGADDPTRIDALDGDGAGDERVRHAGAARGIAGALTDVEAAADSKTRVSESGNEAVPTEYRELLDAYYRDMAERRRRQSAGADEE
jgi:hypothetical protein